MDSFILQYTYKIIISNYSLTFPMIRLIIISKIILIVCSSKLNQSDVMSSRVSDLQKIQKQINDLQNVNSLLSISNSYWDEEKKQLDQFNNQKQQATTSCNLNYSETKGIKDNDFVKNIEFNMLQFANKMQNNCELQVEKHSFYFVFQTPKNSYIGVNRQETIIQHKSGQTQIELKKYFYIFNSQCQIIAKLQNTLINQIYCDRGLCDDGNIIILTQDLNLKICSQLNNFTECSTFSSLKNTIKGIPVGGAVRNKGSNQFQIYIGDSDGQIIVLDSQGKLRLTIPVQVDSRITHFVDIHPHPLVISERGWIYSFQNTKFTVSLTKCPYLFHEINQVFVGHPYTPVIYLISAEAITKLEVKSQAKTCTVLSKAYIDRQLEQIRQIQKSIRFKQIKKLAVAQYQNNLYIRNKIVNIQRKTIQKFANCGQETIFNFQQMKNNYRKGFFTLKCCKKQQNQRKGRQKLIEQRCSIIIFKSDSFEEGSSKNSTIITLIILILVIVIIFFFVRSSSPNLDYDQQLRYSDNLTYKSEVQQFLKSKSQKIQQASKVNSHYKDKVQQKKDTVNQFQNSYQAQIRRQHRDRFSYDEEDQQQSKNQ